MCYFLSLKTLSRRLSYSGYWQGRMTTFSNVRWYVLPLLICLGPSEGLNSFTAIHVYVVPLVLNVLSDCLFSFDVSFGVFRRLPGGVYKSSYYFLRTFTLLMNSDPFLGGFLNFPFLWITSVSCSLSRTKLIGLIFWSIKSPVPHLISLHRMDTSPLIDRGLICTETRVFCVKFSLLPNLTKVDLIDPGTCFEPL